MISIQGVSHAIGDKRILNDVTTQIAQGGITALIGPNGAGKSTLLSLIARLEPLQTGRIHVDALEIGACSDQVLAQHLSILPQMADHTPRLTVKELVGFGRYPYNRGRPTAQDDAKVAQALGMFGLNLFADRTLDTLSGGQKQRAHIAMIFAQDTDYVLLDEPLNNLDIAAGRSLMKTLQRMCEDHRKTIVIVLHDINVASRYADQIIAMRDGSVITQGRPAEIVDSALVQDVFETDAPVVTVEGTNLVLM
ncbi:ABC transporter ATP-binding protein [Loktanella sp. D2R18]|uniref:iron ABC transporter ATP-binding protein n=1 Tax=Rhodobacterales TaxID=204455 RepID=UPI000DE893E3|nr:MULTISPECIES: ATP-binding cassette domain-containing protein [Rhodobacterales]MDO6589848.1 ATP-binding cassette domain-containing protein [Yoonia sp. 1_MG-2023]RBW45998.1 ABC transporter ATP-binding protein [Loktanella sp. D2R18]